MDRFISAAEVAVPILVCVLLGLLARKRNWMTPEEVRGLQQFVMKIGLPCVIFQSCLTARISTGSLGAMALALPCTIAGTFWGFFVGRKKYAYHNFPMLFCCQETGMLGIPLFIILFGAANAYHMGILDLAQALTAYPVIAILSAATGENPTPGSILKGIAKSVLLIASLLGLFLNLFGIGNWMDSVGIGGILTDTTSFLSQPVSAMMIFSVGYNFSLDTQNRGVIFRITALRLIFFGLFGLAVQGLLSLIPGVDPLTRWSLLLFSLLPASYLAPSLGRSQQDLTMASGVCSVTTLFTLLAFCGIAFFIA